MTGIYKIADKTIEIISLHKGVHMLCKDYICEGTPDFSVKTEQKDIDFERMHATDEGDIARVSDNYLETLAVYRKIADKMLDYDTILFHGSCIAVDGKGYLFTAKSGTGKSTHTRFWREYFGDRAMMINDDKPLIRMTEQGAIVYGTPWNGKHRLGENTSAPLHALCVLERANENHIEKINKKEVYTILLQQTHRPGSALGMHKMLSLVDKMTSYTSFYRLGCNLDPDAARVAYEGMQI